jgi:hypothetical protein
MEMLDAMLRMLNSYPTWAKLCAVAGVSLTVLVLIFAPRVESSGDSSNEDGSSDEGYEVSFTKPIFLRIKSMKLFPADPAAEVQVRAIVNETVYQHPSVDGVEWMKVGPSMSQKVIELPNALNYQIRFTMLKRKGGEFEGDQLDMVRGASQQVTHIDRLPFSENYSLYNVNEKTRTRDAAVSAVISYTVSYDGK